jgi:hypothetical protein
MRGRTAAYVRRSPPGSQKRIIVIIPNEEADNIDDWGVAAAMPSRTAAIRHLLKKGLEAVASEAVAGRASQA